MRGLRVSKKIFLGFVSAVALVSLAFVGVNSLDEALNPAVKPMLEVPAMSLPAQSNGYYFVLGFRAAADKDPHAVGVEIDNRVRAHFSSSDSFVAAPTIDATLAGNAPPLPEGMRTLCNPGKRACLDAYLAAGRLEDLERAAALYLERHARLLAYPGYEDRPFYTLSNDLLPSYTELSFASQLFVARAARLIAAGEYREGARRISEDLRFWRRVLQGSRTVLGKVVATSRTTADLRLLNELMARYPAFARDQSVLLAEMARPLSAAERDFCAVERIERTAAFRQLHALGQSSWRHRQAIRGLAGMAGSSSVNLVAALAPVGYVPNATLNLMLELNEAAAPVCGARPALLAAAEKEAVARTEELLRRRAGGLAMLYNPIGKSFLNAIYPDVGNYPYRLHDLDGYLRATALHIRAAVGGDNVPDTIARAEAAYHDPYTEKPMVWNGADSMLSVTQKASRNAGDGAGILIRAGRSQ